MREENRANLPFDVNRERLVVRVTDVERSICHLLSCSCLVRCWLILIMKSSIFSDVLYESLIQRWRKCYVFNVEEYLRRSESSVLVALGIM